MFAGGESALLAACLGLLPRDTKKGLDAKGLFRASVPGVQL
jgi:hypothetical protein